MQRASFSTVALLALAMMQALPASAGTRGANWAREHVRQHEAAVLDRVLGRDVAAQMSAVKPPALIVGGLPAPAGRWPFQVALLLASIANNYNAQFCGGTIVDEEFILTAAHCVDFLTAGQLHILTHTQSLTSGGTRRAVKRIRIHPSYNDLTFEFDVALVQLKSKMVNLSPERIVAIITRTDEPKRAETGTKTFVTGWGDTGTSYPVWLREVSVPIVSRRTCNSARSYGGAVTTTMLCAGLAAGGKDSCQGDSGGPLLVKNAAGRFRLQAGVVSWGDGCALPNKYGVYSRLAVLQNWIAATMAALATSPVSARACENSGDRSLSPACRRAAREDAEREMAAYLDLIKRKGSAAQAQGSAAAQRTWSQSVASLCAFHYAAGGQQAREDCVAEETRKRADALAVELLDLPN